MVFEREGKWVERAKSGEDQRVKIDRESFSAGEAKEGGSEGWRRVVGGWRENNL